MTKILILSEAAVAPCRRIVGAADTSFVRSADTLHQDVEAADSEKFVVVVEPRQFDSALYRELCLVARRGRGIRIGLAPFFADTPEALSRFVLPAAADPTRQEIGVCDNEDVAADLAALWLSSAGRGGITRIEPEDQASKLTSTRWNAIAVISGGRQTHISLGGRSCLHSGVGLGDARPGVYTPRRIDCRHWLLQSCHSPFVWPSYGSKYLTVPLSLATSAETRSVICSTRLQTMTPGLLAVYLSMLAGGSTVGDICVELNEYCRRLNIDNFPFILIGHPDTVISSSVGDQAASESSSVASVESVSRPDVGMLRNCICNVGFLFGPELGIEGKLTEGNRASFGRIRDAYVRAKDQLLGSAPSLRAIGLDGVRVDPAWKRAFEEHRAGILSGIGEQLGGMPPDIRRLFNAFTGYYYYLGPELEKAYHFVGVDGPLLHPSHAGDFVFRKELGLVGPTSVPDYETRLQTISLQGLMVADVCGTLRDGFVVSSVVRESSGEWRFTVEFTNRGPKPKHVFAFARLTDPNNVSFFGAQRLYRELLRRAGLRRNYWDPVIVKPNESLVLEVVVDCEDRSLFYLLVEVNVLVDFGWNWFSRTLAMGGIEAWLHSKEHHASLPQWNV